MQNRIYDFYQLVKKIPRGKVATYGQLARICGFKTPRYAGYLLSKNEDPENIPCHRVVNSKGEIAGSYAFGGLAVKKQRLITEGIEIKNNKIDLKKYLWNWNI